MFTRRSVFAELVLCAAEGCGFCAGYAVRMARGVVLQAISSVGERMAYRAVRRSGSLLAMTFGPFDLERPLEPSEFGGKEGLVQAAEDGHELTASEKLAMAHRTNPADPLAIDPATGLPAPPN